MLFWLTLDLYIAYELEARMEPVSSVKFVGICHAERSAIQGL
jgi:hypothetical protein